MLTCLYSSGEQRAKEQGNFLVSINIFFVKLIYIVLIRLRKKSKA